MLPSPETIRAEKARRKLADWCRFVDEQYVVAAHHRRLIDALERVERGELKRLIVSMPPRHGKSLTSTVRFPAWYLGRNPEKRLIIAAHTAELAYDFSRRCRNEFVEHSQQVFGEKVSDDSAAVSHWDLANGRGGMVAAGVGGPITGKGADLLVIDDPVKDAEAAQSETQRSRVLDWWRTTARTRLHPGGAVVVVMTRWHEMDLAGYLLDEAKRDGEQWELLTLPMLDEAGGILWPERFSADEVANIRRAVGSRVFEALYQQRPAPAEGALLQRSWWKTWESKPKVFDVVLQSWDMTFKDTAGSDFVVGQVWGKVGGNCYLLDQVRARMDFPATCRALEALSEKWPAATLKLVEDKANGPAVISTLRDKISGLVAVEPDGSKEARAAAVSPMVEAGNVFLPPRELAPWVEDFLLEATAFPFGQHDDQVDAATQALNRLRTHGATHVARPKLVKPKSDAVTM